MYTLGYRFRPWRDPEAIADGPAILSYIRETATEYGVDKAICYGHRVRSASWSSLDAHWTVEVETGSDEPIVQFTCNFLYLCTGYYDYESGYTPEWPGVELFRGMIVHPQKWPDDLDYANKRIVVIGSGATAITLVPALAKRAAHVTMLQRSPSYVVSRPSKDVVANLLRRCLPDRAAYVLARWKNVLEATFFYNLARKKPELCKRMVAKGVRRQLGMGYESKHFTPPYNPWDQRLCFAPDSDFFLEMREGRVSVVTDSIETFTGDGLLLRSGQHLPADIVVTATGLVMKLISGMPLEVDTKGGELSLVPQLKNGRVQNDSMANLDNNPDVRYTKGDKDKPKNGVDDQIAFNYDWRDKHSESNTKLKLAPNWTTTFHELAEAYAKVDGSMQYAQAHQKAIDRETKLRDQRPYLKDYNPGSGPGTNIIIKQ
jgi:cation diffusion facilitator CzcD-associated flavoprotein CzcO